MKYRKLLIYTGVAVVILAALAVGSYYYALHYYSRQIDKFIDILLAETLEESHRQDQEKAADDPTKKQSTKDSTETDKDTSEKREQEDKEKEDEEVEESASAEKEQEESAPQEDEPPGLDELEEKYTPAFQKVDFKDQLFTLQMLRKFSAGEIQEMFRLYEKGGSARRELLKKLQGRISPEDMERIIEIAKEYRGLL